jgi:hypothetical protein
MSDTLLYFDEVIVEKYYNDGIFFKAKKRGSTEYSYHAIAEKHKEELIKISAKFSDLPANNP